MGQPVPQRIGDAERDRAIDLLRDHLTAGRLDTEEFDERLGVALSAKTSADLEPLFTDLPGPRPGQEVAKPAAPASGAERRRDLPVPPTAAEPPIPAHERHPGLAALATFIWPITALAITFIPGLGWANFWWLMFIPIVISSAFGRGEHQRREHERRRIERDQRELDRRRRAIGD